MIDPLASPPGVWRLGGEARRNGRWISGVAAAILGGLLAAWPCGAQLLDAVVARVDQSVVTLSEVVQERELKRWAGEAGASLELNAVADLLVRRRLVVAEAVKMRLEASAEEVAADLERLVSSGGRPDEFWERVAAVGLTEADIRRRCRDVLLTRQYLSIRQEMTYVPEAEVRAYVAAREGADNSRASPEGREEVRALLARRKYEQELHQWVARQVLEGRVRMAGEMELERFRQSSPPLR